MNDTLKSRFIRRAELSDAQPIAALVREAALSDTITRIPFSALIERVRQGIKTCLDGRGSDIFVVAGADAALVAYAVVQWHITLFLPGNEGYISELTVSRAHRGQGIGGMLLDRLMQEGKARNCARMSLINCRFRDSYKRGFYTKRGWQEREVAANFVCTF